MNKEEYRLIFDMDGTLYQFDKGKKQEFIETRFSNDLRNNVHEFFMSRFGLDREEAMTEHQRISTKYKGEVSLGVETEYRINRYDYFAETWGSLDPEDYIETSEALPEIINALKGKIALLTAAPRIWAVKVLAYLHLEETFGDAVYTGEPDVRKPNQKIFKQVAAGFKIEPSQVFSIGDQEESDIVPAQAVGMKTIHIGKGETKADYQAEDVIAAINLLIKEGFL